MKNVGYGGGQEESLQYLTGPVNTEQITHASSREKRREAFENTRLEIYRLSHRIVKRLLDDTKPLPISAEQLAFEHGFGTLTLEQMGIIDSMLEQIGENKAIITRDYSQVKEAAVNSPDIDVGYLYFTALYGKLPKGDVLINQSRYGLLELQMLERQNLSYYLRVNDLLQKEKMKEDELEILRAWGDKYPVKQEDKQSAHFTAGNFSPARKNSITKAKIPTLLVTEDPLVEETINHETAHYLNDLLTSAIFEINYTANNENPFISFEDTSLDDAVTEIQIESAPGIQPDVINLQAMLKVFKDECLKLAWDEITADLIATNDVTHINQVISPGWYEYYVQVFGDIRNFNETARKALIAAREDYYDTIKQIGGMILDIHEDLVEEGDQDKIDALFGMMRAKPIQLWSREVRRMFSSKPKDIRREETSSNTPSIEANEGE